MPSEIARVAQELEVLVARAVRAGELDVDELLDTYARLAPGSHEHVANERRVDLDAMEAALAALPRELLDAYDILVVPRLDGFEHQPVEAGMLPAGRLGDGTLLIEAAFSHVSLVNLAAPLCALAHEVDKAQPLLAAAGLVDPGEPPGEVEELPLTDDDEADAPESQPTAEVSAAADAAQPVTEVSEAEDVAEAASEEGESDLEDRGDLEDLGDLEEFDGEGQVSAALARIAFALGVDQSSLEAADDRTEGALLRLLLCQAEVPRVRVHAELQPAAAARRAVEHSQQIVATLAETGLLSRPIHLWIGGGVITECVSPYARELRDVLLAWARENPEACADDIELHDPAGEDLLYGLAHDFLSTDPALAAEREVADRTVGIQRHKGRIPFEIIDLGRVDPSVSDARLSPWAASQPAPVLLRVTPDLEDTDGTGVRTLLRALSTQLASVTLVLEGTALAGGASTIVLPNMMVRWAGEHMVAIPDTTTFASEDFLGYANGELQQGAILSVSSAALLSPVHVGELARTYGVAAIEVGAAGLVQAVAEARWAGEIAPATPVRWALVSSEMASTGRPDLATLSASAVVAIAGLRAMLVRPRAEPEPPPPPEPKAKPPLQPGRPFMIKA